MGTDLDGDDEFYAFRDELVDEIRGRLVDERREDAADLAAGIEMLLDWRWAYSNRNFAEWHVDDIDEFLLEWVPRKYLAAPEQGAVVASAVAEFFMYMGARERIFGDTAHVASLVARAWDLSDDVVEAMSNPNNFGIGKSMFAVPGSPDLHNPLADVISMIESGMAPDDPALQSLIQSKMDEFNALPFEDRKAITDPGFAPKRITIPVVNVQPGDEEVADSIRSSTLCGMVDRLVEFVGTKGVPVTQAGNLRLAEARTLVELLNTGDLDRFDTYGRDPDVEHGTGEHPSDTAGDVGAFERPRRGLRSADELPVLTTVFGVAEEAGAFERLKTKIKASPRWMARNPVERAVAIVDALIALGPISSTARTEFAWQLAMFLEDGIPHWLSVAVPSGAQIDVDGVIADAVETVETSGLAWPRYLDTPRDRAEWVADDVARIFAQLHFAGVIEWNDRNVRSDRFDRRVESGGWFRLTPLGRVAMIPHIHAAGYDFSTLPSVTDANAADLIHIVATTNTEIDELVAKWQPGWSTGQRAHALADVALEANDAGQRLVAIEAIALLSPVDEVAPIMREMLDSPLSGYAASYLLTHELADPDEMQPFMNIGPLVDMLTTLLDEPKILAQVFAESAGESAPDLIEDLWRYDHANTIAVLDALGRHLPDKTLAKRARKAIIRHRTWMANRHPQY